MLGTGIIAWILVLYAKSKSVLKALHKRKISFICFRLPVWVVTMGLVFSLVCCTLYISACFSNFCWCIFKLPLLLSCPQEQLEVYLYAEPYIPSYLCVSVCLQIFILQHSIIIIPRAFNSNPTPKTAFENLPFKHFHIYLLQSQEAIISPILYIFVWQTPLYT